MVKKRMNSLKKNIAILVCVAFISVLLPEVTHAATPLSPTKFPFSKKSFSLFSPVFSFANLDFPLAVCAVTTVYILLKNYGKTHHKPVNTPGKKNAKKNNNIIKNVGNSTSKKPPKNKD